MSNVDSDRKRKRPDTPDLLEFELEDLALDTRHQGDLNLIADVIWDVARRSGLTLEDLEKYEAAPSFSNASWEDVASKFNLDPSKGFKQLPTFSFPIASLPPSFHREVMKASAKWLDVYQERDAHDRGAARVRFMDAWLVPVCALFKGRLVEQPKSSMPNTPETSGGEVVHEVYMTEGIVLLVFELKLEFKNTRDHVAQVLLGLVSAYKRNSNKELRPQPPVYAILTDLEMFYFFCYDGSQFTCTEAMFVSDESRPKFLAGMRRVSDHLFSVLLEGYIGTLAAVEARSTMRGLVRDHDSAQALDKARVAQHILVSCKRESLQSWEEVGCRGLFCLNESVSFLPKIGSVSDLDATTLDNEIEKVLLTAIKEPYE
ncbi:hypothetical protein F5888DRAFT_1806933 [Russula emetica]|nr:hypothetical protein F5888DRAFT_1806933 [Russula emetica]